MKQTPAHDNVNRQLLDMVPAHARRLVDVGCMQGAFARAWRERCPDGEVVGIDIDPDYAAAAAAHCTRAIAGNVEDMDDATFASLFPSDCWVFGDCLEHLRDPWALLSRVHAAMAPGGTVVACIPNAQHWSVQWRLATGNFRYEDDGLMDRTHIRWFTRTTMFELFERTGWRVEQGIARKVQAPQQERYLDAVRAFAAACGADAELAARDAEPIQYVFRVVRT